MIDLAALERRLGRGQAVAPNAFIGLVSPVKDPLHPAPPRSTAQ
jgi:hypothetical protein